MNGLFHENWYPAKQLETLERVTRLARPLAGQAIEIGCWEGKSTVVIARALYPDLLDAVDTWQGNIDESPDHLSVTIARERDVFAVFQENMRTLTQGNVRAHRRDCFSYLGSASGPVRFCHIDASHDYRSVRRTIELLLPRLVTGGVLCGDDFRSSHAGRADLDGGVERAVRELLPGYRSRENFWWFVRGRQRRWQYPVMDALRGFTQLLFGRKNQKP